MKRGGEQLTGEAGGVNHEPGKKVRFASVVSHAGQPEVYLPLSDPKHDRAFMRAVKEHRVLSVKQEPTAKRKDFGVVGFDEGRHNTYLVFRKPLTKFLDARIVGIKYDVVSASPVSASRGVRPPKLPQSRPVKSSTFKPKSAPAPEPPKRVEPKPKEFRVRVRITIVTEKDVTVKAFTKAEAKAEAEVNAEDTPSDAKARALSVIEI